MRLTFLDPDLSDLVDPTADQIREDLLNLPQAEDPRAVLEDPGGENYMQLAIEEDRGALSCRVEYREYFSDFTPAKKFPWEEETKEPGHVHAFCEDVELLVVVELFQSYLSGDERWRTEVDWKPDLELSSPSWGDPYSPIWDSPRARHLNRSEIQPLGIRVIKSDPLWTFEFEKDSLPQLQHLKWDGPLLESKEQIMAEIGLMDSITRNTTRRLTEILLAPFADCDRSTQRRMQSEIPANAAENIERAFLEELGTTSHRFPSMDSEAQGELFAEFLKEHGESVCRVASSIAVLELKKSLLSRLKRVAAAAFWFG